LDVWHPHVRAAEPRMVTALSQGIQAFTQSEGGFGL
jgi:hypothetical protein